MKSDNKIKNLIKKVDLEDTDLDFNNKLIGRILNSQSIRYEPLLSKKVFFSIGLMLISLIMTFVFFAPDNNLSKGFIANYIDRFVTLIYNVDIFHENSIILITLLSVFILLIIDMIIHRSINKNIRQN